MKAYPTAIGEAMNFVTDRTIRFIQEIREVQSIADLENFMAKTLEEFQIEYFALFELGRESRPGAGALMNFPNEWVVRYLERRYEYSDPVHIKVVQTKSPFLWNTLEPEGYLNHKPRRIFLERGEFGLKDGCTFPILDTNGYTAVISFVARRLEDDPRLFPAMQLISHYFHGKYKELCGDNIYPVPNLSPRERECLTWAAAGKTEFEIGEILSISAATVHTHMDHARQKLGVGTTIQAIVEAMRHHLIRA